MGKTALVTGGAGGIGAAVCRALAEDGWNVVIAYHRSGDTAEKLAAELGGRALSGDLTVPEEVEALFAQAGEVDLLVNNAGISHYGLLTDMTYAEWQSLFRVNTDAVFLCCRAAIPHMVHEKRGCILNVSSMWGQVGGSCEAAYSASKAAVIGLTKALAKELGPSGIRVNCVAPGVIQTRMLDVFSAEDLEALRQETPLEALGTPEDVGNLVAFLASDKAKFLTGQVIGLNGGFVI
jgi:3-oxoacyl-[acyl-carrier protein] reductase